MKLARALLEAVAEGGFDAARDLMHPNFEMSQLPLHPEAGTYRGATAAAESMEAWIGTFEEFRWEVEEFIDAADRVVVVVREQGRGRGSGVALDHHYGMVCTVRDGKIALVQWFHDKEQAMEAAGLPG